MKSTIREKWLRIYEMALRITEYQPWEDMAEFIPFTFMVPNAEELPFYTLFGGGDMQRCFGFYPSHNEFLKAKKRILHGSDKDEPDFILQNGIVGYWDDRENVSKENYALIKELGLNFRGRGNWLHFEKLQEGYLPAALDDEDVDFLLSCMSEFVMMVIALYEKGMLANMKKGDIVIRWYDEKTKLFMNHCTPDTFPKTIEYPRITLKTTKKADEIKRSAASDFSYEMDWSYLFMPTENNGDVFIPQLLLLIEKKSGFIVTGELLSPEQNKIGIVLSVLENVLEKYGKPKELFVCDNEMLSLTEDFCRKFGIKLTKAKTLPEIKKARKSFLNEIK